MIKHTDIPSTEILPYKDLIMVKPRELPQGEVTQGSLVIEMEQNTSIVDRPTLGTIVSFGKDIEGFNIGDIIMWVERDGMDVQLQDGMYLFIQEKSVLGTVKNIKKEQ